MMTARRKIRLYEEAKEEYNKKYGEKFDEVKNYILDKKFYEAYYWGVEPCVFDSTDFYTTYKTFDENMAYLKSRFDLFMESLDRVKEKYDKWVIAYEENKIPFAYFADNPSHFFVTEGLCTDYKNYYFASDFNVDDNGIIYTNAISSRGYFDNQFAEHKTRIRKMTEDEFNEAIVEFVGNKGGDIEERMEYSKYLRELFTRQ